MNATSWKSARRRLERTTAHIVLIQETKVLERDVAKFSAIAHRMGWQTIWSPANVGKKGKPSGGVAVCARQPVNLSNPPRGPTDVVRGRVVAAMAEAPGCRPAVVYCGYLRDGVGANEENLSYLARIGAHRSLQPDGVQVIVGADFNLTSAVLEETGFPSEVGGVVVSPGPGATTCRTARSASLIDYFVLSEGMAKGVEKVQVVERSGIKAHLPVVVRFHPRLTSLRALTLRRPPTLKTEPIIGPREPPPDWGPLASRLRALSSKARRGGRGAVDLEFQKLFEQWSDLAEREIHAATGEIEVKLGLRGRVPRLVWRSILPEKVDPRSSDVVIAVRALGSLLDDARRIAEVNGARHQRPDQERAAATMKLIHEIEAIRGMPGAGGIGPLVGRALNLVRGGDIQGDTVTDRAAGAIPSEDTDGGPQDVQDARGGAEDRQQAGEGGGELGCPLDLEEDPFGDLNARGGWDDEGPPAGAAEHIDDDDDMPELYDDDSDDDGDAADDTGEPNAQASQGRGGTEDGTEPWAEAMRQLAQEVADREQQETRAEMKGAVESWRSWIKENAQRGMRHAHLHTKLAVPWAPTTTLREGDTVTADPQELLQFYRNKFKKMWNAKDEEEIEEDDLDEDDVDKELGDERTMDPLPLLSPGQMREASRSFRAVTASTFDGFHLRHYDLLTDDALHALARVFQVAETIGHFLVS